MVKITMMMMMMRMMMKVREDEEVKAQLIQRIDNLTADNDCLKSEMDLVRSSKSKYDNVKICCVRMVSKMAKINVLLCLQRGRV